MHILSPETDNCPSWISGRERMTVENISWSIPTKEYCRPRRGLIPRPPGLHSDSASNWATEVGQTQVKGFIPYFFFTCWDSDSLNAVKVGHIQEWLPVSWNKIKTHVGFFGYFRCLSTIFKSYQDVEGMITKGSVQWNTVVMSWTLPLAWFYTWDLMLWSQKC